MVVIVLGVLLWPTLLHSDVREVPLDPGCCRPEQVGLVVWGSLEQRTVMLLCCYPRVCMGAGPRGRPHYRAHCKRMGAAARATHEPGPVSPADRPLNWPACVLGSQNRGRQTARTETDRVGWKQLSVSPWSVWLPMLLCVGNELPVSCCGETCCLILQINVRHAAQLEAS